MTTINQRGWAWIDEDNDLDDDELEKRRPELDALARAWSEIHHTAEQREFSRRRDYDDGRFDDEDFDYDYDDEDPRAGRKISTADAARRLAAELERAQVEHIENRLAELGARMMRARMSIGPRMSSASPGKSGIAMATNYSADDHRAAIAAVHRASHELLLAEREAAEAKALDALGRYKFQMFGYWAGIWVHLNRIIGDRMPSPFSHIVLAARSTPTEVEASLIQLAIDAGDSLEASS